MFIARLQVEEGFLNGLDLRFSPGLNVLIGARGTGKTSVIETIRYALAARSHTSETQERSLDHARSILSGGQATATLSDGLHDLPVTRGAEDGEPVSAEPFSAPMVFSQTEIETVGLSAAGRLNLIDGFVGRRTSLRAEEVNAVTAIRSIYREIDTLQAEIGSLIESVGNIAALRDERTALVARQAELEAGSSAARERQAKLSALSERLAAIGVEEGTLTRFAALTDEWVQNLTTQLDFDFGPDVWGGDLSGDPLKDFRSKYAEAVGLVREARTAFQSLHEAAAQKAQLIAPARSQVETQSRTLRTEVEKLSEGAGVVARRLAQVNAQIAQAEAVEKLANERGQRLLALRQRRDQRLEDLENLRQERYEQRCSVAARINSELGPRIRVEIERYAQYNEYTRAIADVLRGSGLKYNDLAALISERVSPRELVGLVDRQDFEALSAAASIPRDRAARLVGYLKDAGVTTIATCAVEDNVKMSLLDGTNYKDISSLSAGQRCTVILPIVLLHKERPLVIDQPEDHIDNAFITDTLIKALRSRKKGEQVILSTHNANIPVLGNADLVVEMTSDGRNGFVELSKPLEDPQTVFAITTLMEGGREAFKARSDFYSAHMI